MADACASSRSRSDTLKPCWVVQEEREFAVHERVRKKLEETINPSKRQRQGQMQVLHLHKHHGTLLLNGIMTFHQDSLLYLNAAVLSAKGVDAGETLDVETGRRHRIYTDGVDAEVEEI